ncbi:MAG TPA: MgtC/SapB family protein [Methylovirgula sp.]|nr:MgtC/SapB family protein [Methylovirgula sp.]
MSLNPTWQEIALRLILTLVAGVVIGMDRGVKGHAAGLRTTILVGLAASVAMIQANLLLSVLGKSSASFAVMDVMRLPLGILTGVGFIGGGTILRRGNLVTGVTTAATLWAITVIGLCLGGGQLVLGAAATVIAFAVLWGLRWLDVYMPRERHAILIVEGENARTLPKLLGSMGYRTKWLGQGRHENGQQMKFEVFWKRAERDAEPLDLIERVGATCRIVSFELLAEPTGH